MKAYFQVKGSTNINKIAVVTHDVDVASFRSDSNWYELTESEYKELTAKDLPSIAKRKELVRKKQLQEEVE